MTFKLLNNRTVVVSEVTKITEEKMGMLYSSGQSAEEMKHQEVPPEFKERQQEAVGFAREKKHRVWATA